MAYFLGHPVVLPLHRRDSEAAAVKICIAEKLKFKVAFR